MRRRSAESSRDLPIIKLLPNLLTLTAVCAGLTAIRFAFLGEFEWAVRLVLAAGVLDGLDGRLARLVRSESLVGAELDSLADFLNFGVAPVLILYTWALQGAGGLGWIACLCFSLCCLMRLARFNVDAKHGGKGPMPAEDSASAADAAPAPAATSRPGDYFVGVPSPAGAILLLLPMVVSFALKQPPILPPAALAIYLVVIGLLMISRIPTYSFKNITVRRDKASFTLLGAVLVAAALLIYLWPTLIILTVVYVASIAVALISRRRTVRKG